MQTTQATDLAALARESLSRFVREAPSNRLGPAYGDEPFWGEPLVGFAAGDDPLFQDFKRTAGPEHWTPGEIFRLTWPDAAVDDAELSVVSWVLPHVPATVAENAAARQFPSERWARSRNLGENVNAELRRYLVAVFEQAGHAAVAPMLSPLWKRLEHETLVFTSRWSERHIAHACGLGTFGLCDGLITPLGKAVRLGSVVVRGVVPPTPRPYALYDEYCPARRDGRCGACIRRCPAGALSRNGHDKRKCAAYCGEVIGPYGRATYGLEGVMGCGLCQSGVPCSTGIPAFSVRPAAKP